MRIVFSCLIAAALTGCGGHDPSTSGTIDGRILFRVLGEGVAYEVELYATPIAMPVQPTRGDGHCDVIPQPGQGDGFADGIFMSPPVADLDLGPTISATDGALVVPGMPEASTIGEYHGELATSGTRFSSTWTLTNDGGKDVPAGTLLTLQTPAAVASDPSPIDTTQGPVNIAYTGGDGAQAFHVEIQGTKATIDCYPAAGTTSFALPDAVMSSLDPMITPIVWAETVSTVKVAGRDVLLWVTSDNLD